MWNEYIYWGTCSIHSFFFLIRMSVQKILETTWNNLIKRFLVIHIWECIFFFLFLQRILEFIHHQASGFILLCSLKITFIPFYFLTRLFFPCLSGMPHYHELSKVFLYSFVSFSSWRFTSLQEAWNWRVPQAVGQTKSSPAGHQNRPPSIHSQGGSSWSAFSSLKLLQLIFSPHQVISALMNDTNSQRWLKTDALR